MWRVFTIVIFLISTRAFAQTNGDTKIIVTLIDSVGIYEKAKVALVKNNFIVKDDGNRDTLQTYPREFSNLPGYSVANAVLNGNQVILSGVYGLKRINDWGYTSSPKNYKRVHYFKGSKGWKLIMQVAETIGGQISFSQ